MMKTTIWTAAAVVILVSAVTAWLGFNSANATRAALADGSTKRTALAKEISHARERMTDAERTLADLRAAVKIAQAEAEKQAAAASSATANAIRKPNIAAVVEAHPELRGLFGQNIRASMRVDENYPLFYKAAELTPEQSQKFEALMIEAAEQRMDVRSTAAAQGLPQTRPIITKLMQQVDEKLQAAQTELLGAAGYQQLQDFNRTQPQNYIVRNVVSDVALTSAPFTEAQREQLLNVLTTSVPDATAAANPRGDSYRVLSKTTDWPGALAQAQTFLSPTQFAALKGHAANSEIHALVREFCLREGIPMGK